MTNSGGASDPPRQPTGESIAAQAFPWLLRQKITVPDPEETSVGPERRVGVVLREIQTLCRPFVIAFDELERLRNPVSVSLLEFLLQRGPPNLHLAIACRQIPDGLNVAGALPCHPPADCRGPEALS